MQDIILTDDLNIQNGDVLVDISDIQHAEHILTANPGQYYQYLNIGYGVNKRLNGSFDTQIETSKIKQALALDNINVSTINITGSNNQFGVQITFPKTQ